MSALVRHGVAITAATLLLATPALAGTVVEARIESGSWHGVKWEFRGGAWRDGSYCVAMLIRDKENSRGCGNVRRQGGIGYVAATSRPLPDYVMGPVKASARSVEITFFDRAPIRVPTVPAPRTLQGGMRFFVKILPCPATPETFVARDRSGRLVSRLVVKHHMKAPC